MAQHSRQIARPVARTGRLGVTLCLLAGALCAVSGCTEADAPTVAARLACTNIQGTGGGGSEYLRCLQAHGPQASSGSFARAGRPARGS